VSRTDRILLLMKDGGPWTAGMIRDVTGIWWTLTEILFRLETEGLIVSEWQPGPYPRLRIYRIKTPTIWMRR